MRWIISQRLLPRISGGRQTRAGNHGHTMRTREAIRWARATGATFYDIIEQNQTFWLGHLRSGIVGAYEQGKNHGRNGDAYSTNKQR